MIFSILIANYNNSAFIEYAVKSILSQSFQDFEIIIVDDCSTDNSINIIEPITKTDGRIKLYKNNANRGVGYTKKKCIDNCQGELFAFLDPDDALEKNALQFMVEAHHSHPLASIIHSTHYICDSNLNIKGTFDKSGPIPSGKTFLHAIPSDNYQISHFATFKKKYYYLTQGIDPLFKKATDKDLYYKMEEVGNVFYIDKPLYFYRHHNNSISLNDNSIKALGWEIKAKENASKRRNQNLNCINITKRELSDIKYNYSLLQLEDHLKHKKILKLISTSFLFTLNYPTRTSFKVIYYLFFKKLNA